MHAISPSQGVLIYGTLIAVKQLSSKSKQGNREFVNEIGMISALQQPNLVKLHGYCIEGKQLLLVYEYMENNSLAHSLFGKLNDLCSQPFIAKDLENLINTLNLIQIFSSENVQTKVD